ncbi:MAG: FAD-binding oxidoreductase [Crocinitomicaceae bacterium]|nr:FAD-binding oxidoreductase [Crocinitomicaceae bacterium]
MINLQNLSFWEKETFIRHIDHLIIGSGIVGLSTAIYLKQRDNTKKVTILERGFLPAGASTKNAGFSCIGSPSELLDDLKKADKKTVFDTVERRWKGLNNLNQLLFNSDIGYKSLGSHELFDEESKDIYENCISNLDELNGELKRITGVPKVYGIAKDVCSTYEFNVFNKAISHTVEGQIDTGKMMQALIRKARSLNVEILNGIEVYDIKGKELETNVGAFPFENLIICTNGFSKRFFPDLDVEPARAQVVVTSEIPNLKLKGIFHFDAGYYYFRNIGKRVLFGGGRNLDLKGENTEEMTTTSMIIDRLESILKEQIIPYADFKIEHQWAGTMGVGGTKAPIIQQIDKNIFCGIRLGGMGVAIGSLVGKELADLIIES